MKAHISEEKKKEVQTLKKLISEYPIIGIVDLTGLPSQQFQKMRSKLKDEVIIKVTKKRLIKLALRESEENKPGILKLEESLQDSMPAIIFTSQDPFKLSKKLTKNKSSAPAKVGQISPRDIIIPAGPTSFSPGPIIGELGQAGIQAGIEAGKVIIKKDFKLLAEGEEINERKLGILTRFGIMPMEIGLNLLSLYQDGEVFTKDVLSIDEKQCLDNITKAVLEAKNFAIGICYTNEETIALLIQKAYLEAKSLAESQNIATNDSVEKLIKKAETTSRIVKDNLNIQDNIIKGTEEEQKQEKEVELKKASPLPYTKETEKEAQDIITAMKDKAIKENNAHGGN